MLLTLNLILLGCVHLLSLAAACHALLTKHDPRSALGWTATLIFLPVAGLIIYLIFGISRAQSRAEMIMDKLAAIERQYQASCGKSALPLIPVSAYETRRLAQLGYALTSEKLCPGNEIIPLHNGDEAYPAMLEAIYNAKSHVFLSTYIFNFGHAARAFITALENAHARGVDVRVLVDGIGSLYSWRKPWRILAKKGIPTQLFRPLKLFPPQLGINLRSHRKAMICDGTGFTGGMNIADGDVHDLDKFDRTVIAIEKKNNIFRDEKKDGQFVAALKKHRHNIQDIQFRFQGPVVGQLRKAFLLNWSFCTGTVSILPALPENICGDSYCRVVMDGPGDDSDALNDLICGVVNLAETSVRIMTPYFLPTHGLVSSLRSAAQRGVHVHVVLPAKNNLPYMTWASQRILPVLLTSGVRVWYQAPPFAHTKLLCIDGFYSLIGSANLDSRSLRLNFELNTEIYNPCITTRLEAFIDSQISAGKEVKSSALRDMSLPKKLRNAAVWIFSPYL